MHLTNILITALVIKLETQTTSIQCILLFCWTSEATPLLACVVPTHPYARTHHRPTSECHYQQSVPEGKQPHSPLLQRAAVVRFFLHSCSMCFWSVNNYIPNSFGVKLNKDHQLCKSMCKFNRWISPKKNGKFLLKS